MTEPQLLTAPPRLTPLLARGALTSLRKRGNAPYDEARLPTTRLVLAEAPPSAESSEEARAYARVCGFDATDPLPPTYPHVLGFPLAMRLMADSAFPLPLLGLVHTGIELTQHRALPATSRPEISVYAEGLEAHRRGSQFAMVTEARLDGETVWHSRSTYLCRHRTHQATSASTGTGTGTGTGQNSDADPAAEPLPVTATWELPGDLGRRYAAASGDRNPIHLHPLTAKLFGFPRHIAHGMWTFARCLAAAGTAGAAAGAGAGSDAGSGEQGSAELSAHAEFKAPVLLPSTVTYGERDGAFELRGGAGGSRPHLTGRVVRRSGAASCRAAGRRGSSGHPSSGSPGPPSRSS